MSFPFSRISVVGMGLMGGSLARALKRLPAPPVIQGISREEEDLREAREGGFLDHIDGPEGVLLDGVELVVYSTPLDAALSLMARHRDQITERGALITDMVSLKQPLQVRARDLELGKRYVGSHPMVGGTGSGFGHSRDDLFQGARVWMTPGEADAESLAQVEDLWRALGADPVQIEAREHDETMAWASHLPQLTSTALALVMESGGISPGDLGTGGRDMVRLAESGPEIWVDLLRAAPETLLEALARTEGELARLRRLLAEGRLEEVSDLMLRTRSWKESS